MIFIEISTQIFKSIRSRKVFVRHSNQIRYKLFEWLIIIDIPYLDGLY
jgi:hypothetical protein